MSQKLKECPFCGGEADEHWEVNDYESNVIMVSCRNRCSVGKQIYVTQKAWNARQAAQQVQVSEDGWPDNIVADRHEVTDKWVLWYLNDEQAAKCKAALAAIKGGGK